MDNFKILFSGFIIGLFLSYGVKGCNNQKNSLKTIYDTKIDTLIVEKEVYKIKYFKAKENVSKFDTLYVGSVDSICDSLVYYQRLALKNCDTIINISDTLTNTLILRDSIRIETIKNLNKRKLRLGAFGGLGVSHNGIAPTIGIGIVF